MGGAVGEKRPAKGIVNPETSGRVVAASLEAGAQRPESHADWAWSQTLEHLIGQAALSFPVPSLPAQPAARLLSSAA